MVRARVQNSEYIFGGREHNFQTVRRKHAAGDVQISQDERPLIPKFSKEVGERTAFFCATAAAGKFRSDVNQARRERGRTSATATTPGRSFHLESPSLLHLFLLLLSLPHFFTLLHLFILSRHLQSRASQRNEVLSKQPKVPLTTLSIPSS